MNPPLRIAILDLNNNVTNRGIGHLIRVIESYGNSLTYQLFDVRYKNEFPDLSFDAYISSGGPGSPYDYSGGWDKPYFNLVEKLWQFNQSAEVKEGIESKKFVFFICHSFQLACLHFKVGEVTKRKAISFGTYPCEKTTLGEQEPFFINLPNPFWIADFRDWQVVDPDIAHLNQQDFKILALEKERPHINMPRAIMAIRFSDAFFGTQFHPEADGQAMLLYFQDPERKAQVVNNHGEAKYLQMIEDLSDDNKIERTFKTILPNFLDSVIANRLELV